MMNATALTIKDTPMAPYLALLQSMTREQKQIVVTFITESMEEPAKTEKPYKVKPLSPSIKKWSGCASFTEEELENDPLLKAILNQ